MTETNNAVAAFLVRPGALTDDDCRALIESGSRRPASRAEIVQDAAHRTRRSASIRWLDGDLDRGVIRRVRDVLRELNEAYFHFDITGIEPLQLARYGIGDGYGDHIDLGPRDTSRRKLSVTIQLSDPLAYRGGDLVFRGVSPSGARARGTAIVFPSYLSHEVKPVTSGERYSLAAWAVGPPFR